MSPNTQTVLARRDLWLVTRERFKRFIGPRTAAQMADAYLALICRAPEAIYTNHNHEKPK